MERIDNIYFAVRIQLQDLNDNQKMEYRALYSHLKSEGFRDYFFDTHDQEITLSEGMYAILSYDYTAGAILRKAEEAIEKALKKFYPNNWSDKFTLMVSGPGPIYHRNLEYTKSNKEPDEQDNH